MQRLKKATTRGSTHAQNHTEQLVSNIVLSCTVHVSFLPLHVLRVILLFLGLQHATYYHNLYT